LRKHHQQLRKPAKPFAVIRTAAASLIARHFPFSGETLAHCL
jgi:hypothetical protein